MLTLNDGRSELWQWDTGRKLTVDADCSQVHFSNKIFGRSIDVDVDDGMAIIPDILLQSDKDLTAWAFVGTAENGYTKISGVFKINKRNKPADYVFTPADQTTLEEIKEKVESLVQSVNGKTGEVKLTAEDVDAISLDDLQEATNEALAQAKESGEFNGKDGHTPVKGVDYFTAEDVQEIAEQAAELVEVPEGGGIDVTGAEVGQTVKIAEVDEEGRPLKWEAIGMPGDSWELINDFTVQTDLAHVKITTDKNGNGFNLRKIMVFSHILPCLTALKKDNIKGFLSQADAGNTSFPHFGPFSFATGPSATEGKQRTSTFYAEKLSGHYVRVNFTTAYDEGSSYKNQGYVNGLLGSQLINIDELGWTSTNIDMFFAGSWKECIGAGSRFVILGVRE